MGKRSLLFSKELWIEREDFMEVAPKKYFRLAPGASVRLKSGYIITCTDHKKNEAGEVETIYCTYNENSKSGNDTSGISVKGVIHWLSAVDAVPAEIRLYDRLFKVENPSSEEGDFKDYINPDSLEIVKGFVEPSLKSAAIEDRFQFLRKGYFCADLESTPDKLVFNRTVTLKDGWGKKG